MGTSCPYGIYHLLTETSRKWLGGPGSQHFCKRQWAECCVHLFDPLCSVPLEANRYGQHMGSLALWLCGDKLVYLSALHSLLPQAVGWGWCWAPLLRATVPIGWPSSRSCSCSWILTATTPSSCPFRPRGGDGPLLLLAPRYPMILDNFPYLVYAFASSAFIKLFLTPCLSTMPSFLFPD